jgi:hypothetical protein
MPRPPHKGGCGGNKENATPINLNPPKPNPKKENATRITLNPKPNKENVTPMGGDMELELDIGFRVQGLGFRF